MQCSCNRNTQVLPKVGAPYYEGGATQHNLLWKAMGNIEDALKELEDE